MLLKLGSAPKVCLGKSVPKACSKFAEEHQCRSVISIKLLSNIIEIAVRHGCSPENLLHIFRTSMKNAYGGMLLNETLKYKSRDSEDKTQNEEKKKEDRMV